MPIAARGTGVGVGAAVAWVSVLLGALVLASCASGEDGQLRQVPEPQSDPALESAFDRAPEPAGLQALLDESDIVVVAQVEEFVGLYMEGLRINPEADNPVVAVENAIPYSTFRVSVTEYLIGDGPSEVVLMQIGDVTGERAAYAGFPQPPQDERVLLFLQSVEDRVGEEHRYVSVLGFWGQMIERDGLVRYGDELPVSFLPDANLAEVIEQVRTLTSDH